MALSKKQLHEGIRAKFMKAITDYLTAQGEEVLQVKSNEIAIPTLDSEGNEEFLVLTFKVPTGSRDDGEAYDGYGVAQQYAESQAEKQEKAKADAEHRAKVEEAKAKLIAEANSNEKSGA